MNQQVPMKIEFLDQITVTGKSGIKTANPFNEALDLSCAANDEDMSMNCDTSIDQKDAEMKQ